MSVASKAHWCKIEAGHYRRDVYTDRGWVRFDIMYHGETKLWHCYCNNEQFDGGNTLAEAKTYCHEEIRS